MPEEPIWYNIQVSMRYTLCGEFSENNPRLLNPHEAQRCTKASERGFHEMSGGQFWIHRKKFWVIILTGKDEYTAYVEVSKQTGPPAGHRILWLHFFFFFHQTQRILDPVNEHMDPRYSSTIKKLCDLGKITSTL